MLVAASGCHDIFLVDHRVWSIIEVVEYRDGRLLRWSTTNAVDFEMTDLRGGRESGHSINEVRR